MITLAAEIEQQLRIMEPEKAQKFERVVRDMLMLVKSSRSEEYIASTNGGINMPSLADRLKNHPAIGTWPKGLDPDIHVATLRDEWERH